MKEICEQVYHMFLKLHYIFYCIDLHNKYAHVIILYKYFSYTVTDTLLL